MVFITLALHAFFLEKKHMRVLGANMNSKKVSLIKKVSLVSSYRIKKNMAPNGLVNLGKCTIGIMANLLIGLRKLQMMLGDENNLNTHQIVG